MDDAGTSIGALKGLVRAFSKERDWEQFHHPKDLGVALASEVGELLDHFRYKSNERIRADLEIPTVREAVSHELADCLWVVLRLADVCGVDLASSLEEKVRLAALKYPVDRSYGRADKYTAYRDEAPPAPPEGSGGLQSR